MPMTEARVPTPVGETMDVDVEIDPRYEITDSFIYT